MLGLKSRKQQHNQKRMTYPTISYAKTVQHKQASPFQRQKRWMTSNRQSQENKYHVQQPQRGIQYNTSEQEGTVINGDQGIHEISQERLQLQQQKHY